MSSSGTPTRDGDMALGAKDSDNNRPVLIRSSGKNYSISNIGSGGGGGDTGGTTPVTKPGFTASPPSGAAWIPVRTRPNTVNDDNMQSTFGAANGSIGIFAPASKPDDRRQVLLCFKAGAKWFSITFDNDGLTSTSPTGKRFSALSSYYAKRRTAYHLSTNEFSPRSTDVVLPDEGLGVWGAVSGNRGYLIAKHAGPFYLRDQFNDDYGGNLTITPTVTSLPASIPYTSSQTYDNLDSTFGVDDGYIGLTTSRFWVKVYGAWYYTSMSIF